MKPDNTLSSPALPPSRKSGLVPPFWAGCDISAWWKLLKRNQFDVHRSRYRIAAVITISSVFQTALRFIQQAIDGYQIAQTVVQTPPVFVLGHWRSGTTLLHELLALDRRHAAPTTYDCLNPHHFLLTRSWLPALLRQFVPHQRPMDAMAAGWDRPQEDEFGLVLLGQPSPYERIAFPNRLGAGNAALDLRQLPPQALRAWERAFTHFVQALTITNGGRRLILKSPPHTGRIPVLLKLYPNAKFVHIVRDPYAVYASTLNLWRILFTTHGLQPPSWESLPEYILNTFVKLHQAFEESRQLIPPGHLYELRYEDLVRDPVVQLSAVYRELELGDFELARRSVEGYLSSVRGYEPGTHLVTAEERGAINDRWSEFFQQYDYPLRTN